MSAIGPGSIVQAVRKPSHGNFDDIPNLTVGAIYSVSHITAPRANTLACFVCGAPPQGGVALVGHRRFYDRSGRESGFCRCAFRLWPPPTDEALRCEPVDQDEPVPA